MSSDSAPARLRVLVVEPAGPVAATLKRYLEGGGFEVHLAQQFEEALLSVKEQPPSLVLSSSGPGVDGEGLCRQLKSLAPELPVILLYPPEEEEADSRAYSVGADAALTGPLKRVTVGTCVRNVLTIRALQHELALARAVPADAVLVPTEEEQFSLSGSGADFEFFKKLLLMEVKRSRRYRYPISLLLIGLDHAEQLFAAVGGDARPRAYAECLSLLTSRIRDIDLAVPVTPGRYVVFLPHTGREGALIVGERLKLVVQKMETVSGATGSVGIASFEPVHREREISFGSLMKDATDALKKAQSEGGDRVVAPERARRDRISMT